jgi:hypothetical protein
VSRQVLTQAMLVRASQQVRGRWPFPAHADSSRRMCNWPSIPSPRYRPIARWDAENNAKHWNVWSAHTLLLPPEAWLATGYGFTAVWLHRHPSIGANQSSVSIERQFSRIFPAHPRSLASVLIPRPAARRVLLFPDSSPNQVRWVPAPENAPLALGARHSRVASRKSVPRVIRANTTKEN